jgi:probable HAF family extracellular repeat protein
MRAVLWNSNDSVPGDLGFGTGSSSAIAINERGQIAGAGEGEGFFRENGTVTRLGSLGGGGTLVEGMNEQGVVAGTSITAAGDVHAFVWTRTGGMRDLGAGPFGAPGVGTVVVAINDRGDILGYAVPCAVNYQGYCGGQLPVRAILWRSTN